MLIAKPKILMTKAHEKADPHMPSWSPDARLTHAPDNARPPENDPSDFRIVRAAGVFRGIRLPVKLPVKVGNE